MRKKLFWGGDVSLKLWSLVVITISNCAGNLLIAYSKTLKVQGELASDGSETQSTYKYNAAAVVFFTEALKLLISFCLAVWTGDFRSQNFKKVFINEDLWKFSIPAILYFVQNNLTFSAMLYVNATAYVILNQLKILATGVVFYLVFRKKLTLLQWVSLMLLTLGCMTSQLSNKEGEVFAVSFLGFFISMAIVMLSATSGVINEWLMKKTGGGQRDSIHIQNVKLYFFGAMANFLYVAQQGKVGSLMEGFDALTLAIIVCWATTGLAVSAVIKYADVIIKTFATALIMILTSILSIYLFSTIPTINLFIGIAIIAASLFIYNYESHFLVPIRQSDV